ncbi:MAG TPA: SPASM domain-containing protein [Tepidisphaeraceae bacterium]|jgi:radical SAM protein with 4Fe4S-binding SPASM domain
MTNVIAILSMLHESPTGSSAARAFREKPVLGWTLQRLAKATRISGATILCWDDQLHAVAPVADEWGVRVIAKGKRIPLPQMEAVSAAQRWADGWRGGLLATCRFDLGFYGPWHADVAAQLRGDAVVLIDPSAALIDPELIDGLVSHAESHEKQELCFMPAAPGLAGVLLRSSLLARLAAAKAHPGRLLHYFDDQLGKEPLATDACAPCPTPVARTMHRFALDSDRQVERIGRATESLNGQLIASGAEELVGRVSSHRHLDRLPREIVLELNASRSTRPIFWPGRALPLARPDLSLELARSLFDELASADDTRLTLAGVGDPLLCERVFKVVDLARHAGVAIHLETDLHGVAAETIDRLAAAPVDVVSFHLPALSPKTYAAVMGCDGYRAVLENVKRFLAGRQARGSSLPILVPIFTKCQANFGELEAWYDQWLRAVGTAVIRGPSDCAGQIPDVAMADMAPSGRRPCGRIQSRLTILSDGRIVSCEEDVAGRQVMGRLGNDALADVWRKRFESLRDDHRRGDWNQHPLCARCREWHRP